MYSKPGVSLKVPVGAQEKKGMNGAVNEKRKIKSWAQSADCGGRWVMQEELLTARDVLRMLRVSLPCVYSWVKKGLLPGYKLNSAVRFAKADVDEFLLRNRLELRSGSSQGGS